MKCGSICAGLGGIDLAFENQGFETLWYSEVEPSCNKLLSTKFPKAKSYGDLSKFKPDPSTDRVDVIFGGTPCQDLSVAGKRAGLDGERSGLFFQMVRVCKRLQPRLIVWENVPGAFSSNDGRDFQAVLRAFTGLTVEVPAEGWGNAGFVRTPYDACRWHVAWRVLDAQHFGVPQRRRRIVLVASLGDARCVEILFEPESVRGDSAPSREAGQRVAPTVEGRVNAGGGGWGSDFTAGGGLAVSPKHSEREQEELTGRTCTPSSQPIPLQEVNGRQSKNQNGVGIGIGAGGDVMYTLQAEKQQGVAMPCVMAHAQANAECVSDGSPSLSCNHEAPIVFKPSHYTRDKDGAPSEISPPLSADADKGDQEPICFQSRIARNGHGVPACADSALVAKSTGDSKPLIAFAQNQRQEVRELGVASSLATIRRGDAKNESLIATFQQSSQSGKGTIGYSEEAIAKPVKTQPDGQMLQTTTCVRRLTPIECERLQGLPDGWTAGFSDRTRYRMIGNSVARPVFEWVAARIKALTVIAKRRKAAQ